MSVTTGPCPPMSAWTALVGHAPTMGLSQLSSYPVTRLPRCSGTGGPEQGVLESGRKERRAAGQVQL